MDHSLPGSSVHGILQARILEWVATPSSRGSSQSRDGTCIGYTAGRLLTAEPLGKQWGDGRSNTPPKWQAFGQLVQPRCCNLSLYYLKPVNYLTQKFFYWNLSMGRIKLCKESVQTCSSSAMFTTVVV